ncbi:protein of unknown function DUF6 transmembrane [Gloeothece citriformis PCC 7424]|uniref:EamA domain-containing protein n=1 Tax=Gloeothece citriformis (strain PCC 7424) TaxID=65393 RepID=B7KEG0_GLOC7|nr:EamA family transporter [Gloeothece citriformis]ACK73278.1 protein of unknown function DUF6 transmembrane [Gloeothece citriformis PCC 7424]
MSKEWILPTLGALIFWGFWGFIPKITTQYIEPKSAIVYEVIGAMIVGMIVLFSLQFQPDTHPKGIVLAITTGMLGLLGAFCFLNAVSKGAVVLVSTLSALYPVVTICLATFILGETISIQQGVGIALAVLAIILITA